MTTIDHIAETIATRFDMDEAAAEAAAREYLAQISTLDGEEYDEDNLPQEVADFIIESVEQSRGATPPTLLDQVSDATERVEQIATDLQHATHERDEAIRAAIAAGSPIVHIARAAGLARQSIYAIRDAQR